MCMQRATRYLVIIGIILCVSNAVLAQKKTAEAYLRAPYQCVWDNHNNPNWSAEQPWALCKVAQPLVGKPEDPNADKGYAIEIYVPDRLADATYQALNSGDIQNRPRLGIVYADDEAQPLMVEVSKNDPPATDSEGHLLASHMQRRFVVYLPKDADLTQSYEIHLDYPVDDGHGGIIKKTFLTQVGQEYSADLFTGDQTACKDRLSLRVRFDDEDKVLHPVGKPAPPPNKIPLKYSTPALLAEYVQYVSFRQRALISYLSGFQSPHPAQPISVRIEDSSKLIKPPPELHVTEENGLLVLPNHDEWIPKPTDLPQLHVRELTVSPQNLPPGVRTSRLTACFNTVEKIPASDFSALVNFPASGAAPAATPEAQLPEVVHEFDVTELKGRKAEPAPEVFADAGEVGTRSVDHDLDIVSSFTSSVENKDKKDPNDPNKTVKVRERTTRATLDLLVAPFGIRSKVCVNGPFSPCDRLRENSRRRQGGLYRIVTPFYLDAKVSTGHITEDTLSLNRILFGTRTDYQWILAGNDMAYPTYLVFSGRFSNASDRDFKQAEYKGTFEFRPVLSFLNHPLANLQPLQQRAVVVDDNNAKDPVRILPRTQGGYEFVPFFGGELGRTWARRGQPAEAVKPSDAVKRAYVGMDITLNPFSRTTVTLTDTFYFRFESKEDPRDNYFKGSIDFRLGRFLDSARAAHSIFFSFERGQQPPFDTPGVNALKLGYRIRGVDVFKR